MNFYELHIGDFAKDAGHLSMIEDGAYRRLLDAYYSRERALPADVRACCKLAKASTKPERDAVAYVLGEFFDLQEDGYHQKRADGEIARFQEAEPDREAKRENNRERVRRHRDRRKVLFEELRKLDVVPSYDTPTPDLEALLKRSTKRDVTQPVTHYDTAIHTHSPVPVITQDRFLARTESVAPTESGRACLLMRDAGCSQTNPNHPDLIAALAEGVTPEALANTAREAIEAGKPKPFAWSLATARGRQAEGARPIANTGESHVRPRPAPPHRESLVERAARKAIEQERARQAIGANDDGPVVPDDGDVWPSLEHDVR